MNQHSDPHHSGKHQHVHKPKRRPPHKDWRAWVVIGLMLAGMLVYILTQDESLAPGENEQLPVPAEAP